MSVLLAAQPKAAGGDGVEWVGVRYYQSADKGFRSGLQHGNGKEGREQRCPAAGTIAPRGGSRFERRVQRCEGHLSNYDMMAKSCAAAAGNRGMLRLTKKEFSSSATPQLSAMHIGRARKTFPKRQQHEWQARVQHAMHLAGSNEACICQVMTPRQGQSTCFR